MMSNVRLTMTGLSAVLVLGVLAAGCVSVKGPEKISIGGHPNKVDSSHVPATRSHEEARRLLGEAYERNRYLESKVAKLEREKDELERERDEYERKYEREKDRHD
jgi:TolA-binding protein